MKRLRDFAAVAVLMAPFVCANAQFHNEFATVNSAGEQANLTSWTGAISEDGRFVLFQSEGTNLIDRDGDGIPDVDANDRQIDFFVRDRVTGTTEVVSVNSAGEQANASFRIVDQRTDMSADGRFVAYYSGATNLIDADGDGVFDDDAKGSLSDVFVRDRVTGTTELVSVNSAGIDPDTNSFIPEIYVRDRLTGITQIVSINNAGEQDNGVVLAGSSFLDLSADGRFVVYASAGSNMNDRNGDGVIEPDVDDRGPDIFIHDRESRTTDIISLDVFGGDTFQANLEPRLSPDGNLIVFGGRDMLVDRDRDGRIEPDVNLSRRDVYVFDRSTGLLELASINALGMQGDNESFLPVISDDGQFVAYTTLSTNLVDRDGDPLFDDDATPFLQDVVVRVPGRPPPPSDVPPTVSIGSHFFGQLVTAGSEPVFGTATDDLAVASVTVNGVEAVLTPTGNPDDPQEVAFSALVDLSFGQQLITAIATDDAGNTSRGSVPIVVVEAQDSPPTLNIESPASGETVAAGDVLVSGVASDDSSITSVAVNGVEATLTPTGNPGDPAEVAFSAVVNLTAGEQLITAVATDDGGNDSSGEVTVQVEAAVLVCDVDGNQVVDRNDITLIFAARGETANGPDDPRDSNGDGIITINDGRECVLQCTNPGCAPN